MMHITNTMVGLAAAGMLAGGASGAVQEFSALAQVGITTSGGYASLGLPEADTVCIIRWRIEMGTGDIDPGASDGEYPGALRWVGVYRLGDETPCWSFNSFGGSYSGFQNPGELVYGSNTTIQDNTNFLGGDSIKHDFLIDTYAGGQLEGNLGRNALDGGMITSDDLPMCYNDSYWMWLNLLGWDGSSSISWDSTGIVYIDGECSGLPIAIAHTEALPATAGSPTLPYRLDGSASSSSAVLYDWNPLTAGSPDPAPGASPIADVDLPPGTHRYELLVEDASGLSRPATGYNENEVEISIAGAPGACDGDANNDGVVDVNDISYVLFRLGNPCP